MLPHEYELRIRTAEIRQERNLNGFLKTFILYLLSVSFLKCFGFSKKSFWAVIRHSCEVKTQCVKEDELSRGEGITQDEIFN